MRLDAVASGWLRADGGGRSRGQAVGDGVAVSHEDTAEPDAFRGRADTDAFRGHADPDPFRGHADPDAVGVAEAVAFAESVAEPDAG